MELDPSAVAAGVRLIVDDTVGSTNAEALALRARRRCRSVVGYGPAADRRPRAGGAHLGLRAG